MGMDRVVKIKVDSICEVDDFPGLSKVYKSLRIIDPNRNWNPDYKNGRWDGFYRFMSKDGKFHLGLLSTVVKLVRGLGYFPQFEMQRSFSVGKFEHTLFDPDKHLRDYQKKAIEAMNKKVIGAVVLPPNAGKTEIILGYAQCHPETRVLYLCSRQLLLRQTAKRAEKFLHEPVNMIGSGVKKYDENVRMTCAIDLSLKSAVESGLVKPDSFDVILVDECHRSQAPTMQNLITTLKWKRIFGMTASYPTESRNRVKHWFVRAAIGSPIFIISDKKFNSRYSEFMPRMTCFRVMNEVSVPRFVRRHEIYNLLKRHRDRNRCIATLSEALGPGVLVIVNHVKHGNILMETFAEFGVKAEFIHSKIPVSFQEESVEKLDRGEINCLISSPVIDEGISVNNIRHIINAAGYRAEIAIIQRIGRGRRKKDRGPNTLSIWDFADSSPNTSTRCSKNADIRFEIYKDVLVDRIHDVSMNALRHAAEDYCENNRS